MTPRRQHSWAEAIASAQHSALSILHSAFRCPVGRAAQAAVCKTVQVGATPARDSNFISSIGVERYTPAFQAGILGAIPRCSTISVVGTRYSFGLQACRSTGKTSAPSQPYIPEDQAALHSITAQPLSCMNPTSMTQASGTCTVQSARNAAQNCLASHNSLTDQSPFSSRGSFPCRQ